jgi:cobalt-zinc-cadmium efflux system protein
MEFEMRHKIVAMRLANVSGGAAARVRLALVLTGIVLVVEVAGGLWAHSLALLSDAAHVVTDLVVLALSSFALRQVQRPASARRTFGYQRVGILVALVNALLLGAIVVAIVVEAARRLQHPGAVSGRLMAGAAVVGLVISLGIARSLRPMRRDLTVRSVLIHVWGDAWASGGIIVAGLLIAATGWLAIDPLLSLAIAALIAWSVWRVLAAGVDILLESTPSDLRTDAVVTAVKRVPGVRDLHDLHIWSLGAQSRAMSAHLLIDDQRVTQAQDILAEVREVLAHEFEIEHTTIQFESLVCRPGDVFCVQPDGHPHLDDAHDRMTRRATG